MSDLIDKEMLSKARRLGEKFTGYSFEDSRALGRTIVALVDNYERWHARIKEATILYDESGDGWVFRDTFPELFQDPDFGDCPLCKRKLIDVAGEHTCLKPLVCVFCKQVMQSAQETQRQGMRICSVKREGLIMPYCSAKAFEEREGV